MVMTEDERQAKREFDRAALKARIASGRAKAVRSSLEVSENDLGAAITYNPPLSSPPKLPLPPLPSPTNSSHSSAISLLPSPSISVDLSEEQDHPSTSKERSKKYLRPSLTFSHSTSSQSSLLEYNELLEAALEGEASELQTAEEPSPVSFALHEDDDLNSPMSVSKVLQSPSLFNKSTSAWGWSSKKAEEEDSLMGLQSAYEHNRHGSVRSSWKSVEIAEESSSSDEESFDRSLDHGSPTLLSMRRLSTFSSANSLKSRESTRSQHSSGCSTLSRISSRNRLKPLSPPPNMPLPPTPDPRLSPLANTFDYAFPTVGPKTPERATWAGKESRQVLTEPRRASRVPSVTVMRPPESKSRIISNTRLPKPTSRIPSGLGKSSAPATFDSTLREEFPQTPPAEPTMHLGGQMPAPAKSIIKKPSLIRLPSKKKSVDLTAKQQASQGTLSPTSNRMRPLLLGKSPESTIGLGISSLPRPKTGSRLLGKSGIPGLSGK